MRRKVKDWSRYGYCPTCDVDRNDPCIDRRFWCDDATPPVPMSIPHVDRERLFRKKKDEERTSN